MNFTSEVLLVMLIGIIASATDTDLATNTNILLLILLFLSTQSGNSPCNCCTGCSSGNTLTSFL